MIKTVIYFSVVLFFMVGCSDDDSTKDEYGLPLATQTGENTFGCLVNGEVFTPSGNSLAGPVLDCNYEFYEDGYYFNVQGNRRKNGILQGITISTTDLELEAGITYQLIEHVNGNASGGWFDAENLQFIYTSGTTTGELEISRLDQSNRIISGTFWYDILLPDGEVLEIREGRFDMKF